MIVYIVFEKWKNNYIYLVYVFILIFKIYMFEILCISCLNIEL